MENIVVPEEEPLENILPFLDYDNDLIEEKFEECFNTILESDINNFYPIDAESGDSETEQDHKEVSIFLFKNTNQQILLKKYFVLCKVT